MRVSAANSQARLNVDELHQLRWLLGLGLTLLAFWTLLSLETGSGAWVATAAVIVTACLIFPRLPGRLPGWFWRLSGPALVVVIAADFLRSEADVLPALVRMVSLLALYRCLQYRSRREDLQLVLLGLFMTVLSGVLTLSLLFGFQILVFALMAMALLFVINLQQPGMTRALTPADWVNFRWGHFLGRLGRGVDLRLSLLAGLLFAGMVATSTVIFVAMPRFSFEHSMSFSKLKGESGFSDKIQYGEVDSLSINDAVAFRVDAPEDVVFKTPPYWRMIMLDEYVDGSFRASPTAHFDRELTFSPKQASAMPSANRWKFYLEGDVSEYLPILGPFGRLSFSSAQSFSPNVTTQVYRLEQTSTNVVGYEIENMTFGDALPMGGGEAKKLQGLRLNGLTPKSPVHSYPNTLLGLPTDARDREALKKEVAEINGGNTGMSEIEFVKQTINYLKAHHPASQTVNVTPPPAGSGRDVLVHWMMNGGSGWCQYFAGSFTLLARAAGYPTRVVMGYNDASWNTIEHYYVIRNSNAHAWVEIFDGQNQWLRVDPTPGAEVPFGGAMAVTAAMPMQSEQGWSARLDSLRMLWYRRVINFDQTDQQDLANVLSADGRVFISEFRKQLSDYWSNLSAWFQGPMTAHRAWRMWPVITVVVVLVIFRRWLQDWWLRRSSRGWLARLNRLPPVRRRAGRWLRQFEPAWRAWGDKLPSPDRAAWEGTRFDLLALRYGPLETMPDPMASFGRAQMLMREARRARSRWRNAKK
jgi:protein-glutamine gamma-glutamyltransferase